MLESPCVDFCRFCHGAGWMHPRKLDGKADYSQTVRCSCMKAADHAELQSVYLNQCALPPKAERLTFDTFRANRPDLQRAMDAAMALAEGRPGVEWLTLIGPNDCGKTHLAVAIVNRWLARQRPARYALASIMLKELQAGFGRDGDESYEAMFDFYCRVGLLLIDDLGIEHHRPGTAGDWALTQLETIIDQRGMNCLPLVVTTNKGLTLHSPRIASRLQRDSGRVVIVITAPEYRVRKQS